MQYRNPAPLRNITGQQFRLIEPAIPLAAPVQRHRNDSVKAFVDRHGPLHITRQRTRQWFHPRIFEEMNETSQSAFIHPEAGRMIETPQTGAAGGANTA